MELEARFLEALRQSRPAYDEPPDWRAGLALYDELSAQEQLEMDRLLVRMIDEDYRNPYGTKEQLPFDDVMVNLPAGMTTDDLLCIEAAVLVAAERRVGEAFFALNRLMRAPRWHAMFPRLYWLNYEGFEAQRRLGMTRSGRGLGALLGAAVANLASSGGAASHPAIAVAISQGSLVPTDADPEAVLYQGMLDALLDGSSKAAATGADGGPGVLGQAVQSFLETDSMEECLLRAADLGTEAAVLAGGLAGAYYGPQAAPRRWTSELKDRAQLEARAEELYRMYKVTH